MQSGYSDLLYASHLKRRALQPFAFPNSFFLPWLQGQRRKQRRCKAYSRSCKFSKKKQQRWEGREFELRTASNLEDTIWWPDTITRMKRESLRFGGSQWGAFFFFFSFLISRKKNSKILNFLDKKKGKKNKKKSWWVSLLGRFMCKLP